MTAADFVTWLRGFAACLGNAAPSPEQWLQIVKNLGAVTPSNTIDWSKLGLVPDVAPVVSQPWFPPMPQATYEVKPSDFTACAPPSYGGGAKITTWTGVLPLSGTLMGAPSAVVG